MAVAASGLAASAAWLDRIASQIVTAGAAAPSPPSGQGVTNPSSSAVQGSTINMSNTDFASAFADQSLALASFRADAAVFRTAESLMKTTLDMIA